MQPMTSTILQSWPVAAPRQTDRLESRRITMQPGVQPGEHIHNCPVVGSIEAGSVRFQIAGQPEKRLVAGDVFYEPAGARIVKFDAGAKGATFVAHFLLNEGETPAISQP